MGNTNWKYSELESLNNIISDILLTYKRLRESKVRALLSKLNIHSAHQFGTHYKGKNPYRAFIMDYAAGV
jgi:hypothetical protein